MRRLTFAVCLVSMLGVCGCATSPSSRSPAEEPIAGARTVDLTKEDPDWVKLPVSASTRAAPGASAAATAAELVAISYRSKSTAAIISLFSRCHPTGGAARDLRAITRRTLRGVSDLTPLDERDTTVSDIPALETTALGEMERKPIKLKTVVLTQDDCVYNLLYLARPEEFPVKQADFEKFVAALRLMP